MYWNHEQRWVQRFLFYRKWISSRDPYFIGLMIVIVVAITGAFTLNAKQPTDLSREVQEAARHADDQSKAADLLGARIGLLEQRLDERVAGLHNDLESVRRSIAQDHGLIAAATARLDAQELATAEFQTLGKTGAPPPMADQHEKSTPPSPRPKGEETERKSNYLAEKTSKSVPSVPHLGIELSFVTLGGSTAARGLMIAIVDPGSAAEKAGVQQRDLLLRVAGVAVSSPDQVHRALLSHKGQHHLILTLKRDGKMQFANLKLG